MKQIKKQIIKSLRCIYITIVLMLILFLLTVNISAQDTLGTFRIGSNILLTQECANSSYSNISSIINTVNSTAIISGETEMIRIGNFYYYNLTNASYIGDYNVHGHCDVNGIDTVWAYSFSVTSSGFQTTTSKSIILLLGFILIVFLCFIFFFFGLKIEYLPVKIGSLFLAFVILVLGIGYGLNTMTSQAGEIGENSIIQGLYILFIGLLTVGGLALVLYLIYASFTAFYKMRGLKE